jgi:hypothetical protein
VSAGQHTLRAVGLTSGLAATTAITVTAAPGGQTGQTTPGDTPTGPANPANDAKKTNSGLPGAADDAPTR